jgi:hypothetical protein
MLALENKIVNTIRQPRGIAFHKETLRALPWN